MASVLAMLGPPPVLAAPPGGHATDGPPCARDQGAVTSS